MAELPGAAIGRSPLMIAGLVLAGGAGSRLGFVDKALVELAGDTLLAQMTARLGGQVAAVAVSANGDAGRFASFGLAVLADGALADKGPLAGVAAGLEWARRMGAESLISVPVDTPFVPVDLVARLGAAPSVAMWRGRQHHLVAHWEVGFLPLLLKFLAVPGAYKVRDALALCNARQVEFGGDEDPFLNINTPADLAAAQARLTP